jgi:hypothetical protein
MLHALGVSRNSVLHDRQQRPHFLYAGTPIDSLF